MTLTDVPDARGHTWIRDRTGTREYFEVPGNHGGPRCSRCGYWFCEYCDSGPEETCEEVLAEDAQAIEGDAIQRWCSLKCGNGLRRTERWR
jgi:hypothetical protein